MWKYKTHSSYLLNAWDEDMDNELQNCLLCDGETVGMSAVCSSSTFYDQYYRSIYSNYDFLTELSISALCHIDMSIFIQNYTKDLKILSQTNNPALKRQTNHLNTCIYYSILSSVKMHTIFLFLIFLFPVCYETTT